MSRNKVVLIILLVAAAYLLTPNDGIYHTIKANFIALLPFIMVALIIYLIITLTVLKRAWRKLDEFVCDDNIIEFAKIMNISFDVKRMLGQKNLLDLYSKVNFSTRASLHAKELLYQAMRRKRLDVPQPGKGTDIDKVINKAPRTDAEIKAARIEAAARERKRKNKKKK